MPYCSTIPSLICFLLFHHSVTVLVCVAVHTQLHVPHRSIVPPLQCSCASPCTFSATRSSPFHHCSARVRRRARSQLHVPHRSTIAVLVCVAVHVLSYTFLTVPPLQCSCASRYTVSATRSRSGCDGCSSRQHPPAATTPPSPSPSGRGSTWWRRPAGRPCSPRQRPFSGPRPHDPSATTTTTASTSAASSHPTRPTRPH